MNVTHNIAYIALGSNVGDREQALLTGVCKLDALPHTTVLRTSHIYETKPVGYVNQPAFLNMVIALETAYDRYELYTEMSRIEKEAGRVRVQKWGPRTLDLDLLLFNEIESDDPNLILPHPRMGERQFVLVPLMDVWKDSDRKWERKLLQLQNEEGKDGIKLWRTITDWHSESARFVN